MPLTEEQRTRLDGIVAKMKANGEPEENIRFVVGDFKQKYGTYTDPATAAAPAPEESGILDYPGPMGINRVIKPALEQYRPILEGGGAVVGGILGGGSTFGLGSVLGGAGGFAAGRAAANTIDELRGIREPESTGKALARVPGDLAEGAAYEMLGPVVSKGVGKVARDYRSLRNFLTGTTDARQMGKAAEQLTERSSTGARYEANADEARKIEEATGARFTRGERANDPKAIAFERSQATRGGEFGLRKKEQQAQVHDALRSYFGREFSQGEVDDFLKFVDKEAAGVQQGVKSAQGEVSAEVARLRPKTTALDRGQGIQETLQRSKDKAKAQVSKLYDAVPNVKVESEGLASTVKNLQDIGASLIPNYERGHTISPIVTELGERLGKMRTDRVEKVSPILDEFGGEIKTPITEKIETQVDFSSLRQLRSQTLAAIRDAGARGDETVKTGKLKQLLGSIEEAINSIATQSENPEAADAYRRASAAYRDYSEKYKQGAVASVLQKGPRGEPSRVSPENVGKVFTSPGGTTAIEQLKRAAGPKVKTIVGDELSDSLLTYADDGQGGLVPAKVTLWFKKNKEVLQRHGLQDQYSGLEKSVEGLRGAQGKAEAFAKRPISKVTSVDAARAMDEAFSGKGQRSTAAVARDILAGVTGDVKATAGAKKAFSDMLWQKMQNTARDLAENRVISPAKMTTVLQQYEPALRVFYAGEPEKLKAMQRIQRGFQIANRSNVPITAGSDTAEKLGPVVAGYLGRMGTGKLAGYPLFKEIYQWAGKREIQKIDELLLRATFDPDFAQTLLWATKTPGKVVERRVTQHLATLAAASNSPMAPEREE